MRGFWTPTHLRLLQALQKTDLPYLSEVPIEAGNRKTYQADILVGSRLVVEIDGPIHNKHLDKDESRDYELALLGYTTLRFTNREVKKELDKVIKTIRFRYEQVLRSRIAASDPVNRVWMEQSRIYGTE